MRSSIHVVDMVLGAETAAQQLNLEPLYGIRSSVVGFADGLRQSWWAELVNLVDQRQQQHHGTARSYVKFHNSVLSFTSYFALAGMKQYKMFEKFFFASKWNGRAFSNTIQHDYGATQQLGLSLFHGQTCTCLSTSQRSTHIPASKYWDMFPFDDSISIIKQYSSTYKGLDEFDRQKKEAVAVIAEHEDAIEPIIEPLPGPTNYTVQL